MSMARLDKFLRQSQLAPFQTVTKDKIAGCVLSIVDGVFEWTPRSDNEDDQDTDEAKSDDNVASDKAYQRGGFRLRDINLQVQEGELMAIVGRIGSGKSALLNSFLGETKLLSGQVSCWASATAYVPQRYASLSLAFLLVHWITEQESCAWIEQAMDQECNSERECCVRPKIRGNTLW